MCLNEEDDDQQLIDVGTPLGPRVTDVSVWKVFLDV